MKEVIRYDKIQLVKIKNFFIQLLITFAKPFIPTHTGNRFLIVSTTGLGDTLWGTPAIRALRQTFPNAYISVLTSGIGKQVLDGNPHINEIFVIKKPPFFSLLKLFPTLIRRKIATVLVFHVSQRPVLPFCALLGAGQIIGTEKMNKGLDFLLTERLESKKIHEIERRLQIAGAAGAKSESKQMEIFSTSGETKIPSGLVIGLHPGAKDRFKQWPISHFIALGRKLKEKFNCHIVVTGTSAEKEIIDTITTSIDGAIGIYEGVSIPTLTALLSQLSLYITNDTGPLHIACALKTPTIALFTPTDPLLCGPYFTSHVTVVQKKPTCFPCLRKKCRDPFCLLQISPDEVMGIIEKILS